MHDTPKSETNTQNSELAQTILDNLGAIFRHLFPGVLIVGAARMAFPSRFGWIHTDSWSNLAFTGVVALTIGNAWFALNRYIVHQLVDFVFYVVGCPGPRRTGKWWAIWKYPQDLAKYVTSALSDRVPPFARQHVIFRSSSVLFIYTVAEVGFLFSCWHEPSTVFADYQGWFKWTSLLIFGLGICQHGLTRAIDSHIVKDDTKRM